MGSARSQAVEGDLSILQSASDCLAQLLEVSQLPVKLRKGVQGPSRQLLQLADQCCVTVSVILLHEVLFYSRNVFAQSTANGRLWC